MSTISLYSIHFSNNYKEKSNGFFPNIITEISSANPCVTLENKDFILIGFHCVLSLEQT